MRTWWRVSFFLGGSLRRACPQPLPDFRRPPPSPFPSSRLPRGQGPATTVRPGCGGGMPPHCDTGHQHPQRFRHFNSGAGHGQTVLWGLTQGFAAAKGSANPTVSTKYPTELSPSPQVLLTKKAFSISIFFNLSVFILRRFQPPLSLGCFSKQKNVLVSIFSNRIFCFCFWHRPL